jgi:hypothetical protein
MDDELRRELGRAIFTAPTSIKAVPAVLTVKIHKLRGGRGWQSIRRSLDLAEAQTGIANDFLALQGCYGSTQKPERLEVLN